MLGEEVQEYNLSNSSIQYCNNPRGLWLDDSGHFYHSAALWKPMQSSRITEAVRLLSHNSWVRNSWEPPNDSDKLECHRMPLPKPYRSKPVAPPAWQSAGAPEYRLQAHQGPEWGACWGPCKVITTRGTSSSSERGTILALELPWSFYLSTTKFKAKTIPRKRNTIYGMFKII